MIPKYSKRVYIIVKLTANSAIVNRNNEEMKVKKSQLIKSNIENNEETALEKANKKHKKKQKMNREELN